MVHDSLCYGEAWVVGIPPPLHVGWDGGHIMPWGPRPCLSSSSSLLLTVQPRYHYPPLLLLPECITILSTPPTHIPLPPPPQVYAPSRTVVVYAPADTCDKQADHQVHGVPGLGVKGLGPYYAR